MADTEYICLDTEFVNNISIIELSVFSISGREMCHRLFRPARDVRWTAPPDKLKITPEMVANEPTFRQTLTKIQPIFDRARFIIGYAIDNDIKMLRKEGVEGLDDITHIEVRDLYWLVRGRYSGVDLYGVPNLIAITNELGMTFDEGEAHFASSDTRATLFCFHKLIQELCDSVGESYDPANPNNALSLFQREFTIAKKQYLREQAHGYAWFVETPKGYKLKVSRTPPGPEITTFAETADRARAEYDILKFVSRREIPGAYGHYRLKESDFSFLRNYTNNYDEESAEMLRRLMKFKGRLSF